MASSSLRSQYLLDPDFVYLNHGSYGATPIPVFETYQKWQRELERQPVDFFRRADGLLAEARARLGEYLGSPAENLVYVMNSTVAINTVARSIDFKPGDEILATDQEYPAMNQTWSYICHKTGARYITRPVTMPFTTKEAFVEEYWAGVNSHTRIIFLSHIPFSLGVIWPVEEICRRARLAGIPVIIDGAHAPGQIPLNLTEIGADIYFGGLHKWLSAPKGASFMYASKTAQSWLDPLIISHGWGEQPIPAGTSRFIEFNEYQGTRDFSAFLSVPAAIDFQRQNDWDTRRAECHALAADTRRRIVELTGLPPVCPDSPDWFMQLALSPMPKIDLSALAQRLFKQYKIEVPVIQWNSNPGAMRISFQAYNTQADADALIDALKIEFQNHA